MMKRLLLALIVTLNIGYLQGQTKSPLAALNAYTGTWVIFKDSTRTDTLVKTFSQWSADGQQLISHQKQAGPTGFTRNNCYYSYDAVKKNYPYYETDEAGNKIATSDIVIDGRTWIYNHHIARTTTLWRTLNIFNNAGDEIIYKTQKSDDKGATWTTTRTGTEYKLPLKTK